MPLNIKISNEFMLQVNEYSQINIDNSERCYYLPLLSYIH